MENEVKALNRKYIDIIICLLAVMVMPIYLYGSRVIWLAIASVATAIIVEFICNRIAGSRSIPKGDKTCIITALVVVLLFPATVPVWIVVVSVIISLVIAKHPFGGTSHNTFNPAAVGVAFAAICWPEQVLKYPLPGAAIDMANAAAIQYGTSPASVMRVGGTPKIDYFDVLLGKFAGPMGTTCMIVLGACLVYLLIRKTISYKAVLPALVVVALSAVLLPRVMTGRVSSLVFEFCSGALVFGLIFMTSDPTTMPNTGGGQVLYGTGLGVILMLFRHFGRVEVEFVYGILLANIFEIPCDRYAEMIITGVKRLLRGEGFKKRKLRLEIMDADKVSVNLAQDAQSSEQKGEEGNA